MVPLRSFLVLALLLFSQIGHAQAQDTQWPPDPDTIFPPYVTWTRLEQGPTIPYAEIEGTELLVYLPDGQVERYDLPSSKWQRAGMLPDGNVMLLGERTREYNPDGLILNRETGTYEQPPMVCEDRILQNRFNPTGEWMLIYRDETFEDGFLCNTSTGEILEEIPPRLATSPVSKLVSNDQNSSFSPDHETVIVMSLDEQSKTVIYAYDLNADTWTQIGNAGDIPYTIVSPCGWVSNTQGFICDYHVLNMDDTNVHYYLFDLENPDTLEFVFSSWGSSTTTVLDDPPRYITIRSESYDTVHSYIYDTNIPSKISACTVTIFDAINGLYEQELGGECIPFFNSISRPVLYQRSDETVYILTVTDSDPNVSTLQAVTVDASGPSFRSILTGEIEGILAASPNDDYIALLMGNNNQIDAIHTDFDLNKLPHGPNTWFITVISSEDGQIIYQIPVDSVHAISRIFWLDEQTLLFTTQQSVIHRVMFHEHGADVAITSRYSFHWYDEYMWFLNDRYWVYPDDYAALDFMTFDLLPIVNPEALEHYDIRILSSETVVVSSKDGTMTAVYYISFPN
ncbi:MAG: hypothetical protein CL607_09460 [Anaerolineaceae bacterium]|nr:hypothetical protein [Anaerolineaceae bacterium]